ncbi:APC family permease [Bordetella bronchiseptica]|uniref:Probable amino acid permease n=1 Tax=Bordetella bronchiseptica (strain ATCC BAA-588 / NCTC 13252 / RB50) TaxID=257310 RepID=A0A0H3LGE4_BORBR|nr:amino acid permease [Bordetella bronchiseptica]KAK68610.1 amino acid permease [Bordetella bronchiseptica 980-2]AUV49703.1 amino acid permease [Bordetella bronchiseptica]AZW10572.1 amino acid permease [Bordetella bronchiseptica]KCV49225.1 amino acid permease [Bordetella bronchiseptica 3E44]KCV55932.1 amino acid permease [Bordetella bronchiseptica 980]
MTRAAESGMAQARGLSVLDAVAVLVGVVIGIGIFGFPPLVAQHAQSESVYLALWLGGAAVMLMGALCYAELGSAYPGAGGEYLYLRHAWGPRVALLFAWARCTVIQTGAIAVVAFIYGEYAQELAPLGTHGVALHAAIAVIALTLLNIMGTQPSKRIQLVFTVLTLAALAAVVATGLSAPPAPPAPVEPLAGSTLGLLGMGLVFVLLTYGGWNEAAYLSGELREARRNMAKVLLIGTAVVAGAYLLTNLALLQIFGLQGLRETRAVAATLMTLAAGPYAAIVLSLLVCVTALSTINGTILTGARVYSALGQDVPRLRPLAGWSMRGQTPTSALLAQGAITLVLLGYGAYAHDGVQTLVAYTAPVFWLFMLLVAASVWRLRRLDPHRPRPFRVPLYPLPPLLLGLTCAGLVWSSARYAGVGALLGLAVLAAGLPALRLLRAAPRSA